MVKETRKALILLEMAIVYLLLLVVVTFFSSIVGLGGSRFVKMALSVALYAVFAAVPIVSMRIRKVPLSILGFKKEKLGRQLAAAVVIFVMTICVAVVIPLLVGIDRQDVLSHKSSSVQVLIFYIVYDLICVGFGEEIAFRGYLYGRTGSISSAAWLPMLLSAVLFGFLHFPSTLNLINVAATMALGLLYGLCRWKVKSCSLLSLSIAHGLHDATIILLSFWLL
jgi:membrane protease YdiL (CAAX protease family)